MVRRHGTRHLTSDRHDSGQGEALPQLFHLSAHRARVGAVAFEHLDSHRTPLRGYTTSRRRSGVCRSCRPGNVEFVFIGILHPQFLSKTARQVVPLQTSGSGQFGARAQNARGNQRHGQIPQARALRREQVFEATATQGAEHCSHLTVGSGPCDGRRRPVHRGPRYRPVAGWREGR
jgi:hypothetical protein